MRPHPKSEPSQRQLRVGEQLRHIISETMLRGHFRDEKLLDAGKITVTEVRISPDLKNAKVYVMTLGGEDLEEVLPALNEAAPVFQKEINRHSNLKFTPRVQFKIDNSFDEARKIDDLLRSIHYADEENSKE